MKKSKLALILLITILFSLAPLMGGTEETAEGLYKEGLGYIKQENFDKALKSFNKAIKLDPSSNPDAYFYRAKVYESLGRREEAAVDYLKSCEMGSDLCGEVLPRDLISSKKIPGGEWTVGDFGYHLDPQGGNTYGPSNLADGLPETAWVTKNDAFYIFKDKMITFKPLADVEVIGFSVKNGYCKNRDVWENNSRVKRVMVIVDGEPLDTFTLSDGMEEQKFSLDKGYHLKAGGELSLLILETYPGVKYGDTAISELAPIYNNKGGIAEKPSRPAGLGPYHPMPRGNPARTGAYDEEGVPVLHKLRWKFKTGGAIYSSPSVADGVVYFASNDGNLYAVSADSGKELWRADIGDEYAYKSSGFDVISSPTIAGGVVYFGCWDSDFYALDAKTGKVLWRFEEGLTTSPFVVDGVVYFGTIDSLFAVNAKTGVEKWRLEMAGEIPPPSFADGVIFAACCDIEVAFHGGSDSDNYLFAVDADTGLVKWKFPTCAHFSPAVDNGVVYFDSGYYFIAVDVNTGKELWRFKAGGEISSSPCVANGVAYFGTSIAFDYSDNSLYAVDAKSGRKLWRFETEGFVFSPPTFVDGVVYFGNYDGNIFAVDATSGKELWRFKTDGEIIYSSACVTGGVIYIGCSDGYLYAVE